VRRGNEGRGGDVGSSCSMARRRPCCPRRDGFGGPGRCDIIKSEMSIERFFDEVRMRKYTHKHILPNIKFKLKLLQIKCHILGFTKDKA
jgi:hypothetical protein